jgi:hypothetical protein
MLSLPQGVLATTYMATTHTLVLQHAIFRLLQPHLLDGFSSHLDRPDDTQSCPLLPRARSVPEISETRLAHGPADGLLLVGATVSSVAGTS